jgi:L,D-transpeptidase catalytic domain
MLLMMMLLSACNGDSQSRQKASVQKSHLDNLLANARKIGVPDSMLQPIMQQEQQISSSSAPFTVFQDQPLIDYYNNVALRYQMLSNEVLGLEARVTQQFDYQAYLDIKDLEHALVQREEQNLVEARIFADQLAQDQSLLARARYPKDYLQISHNARRSTQALHLMGTAYSDLESLRQLAQQLQVSHIDTAGLAQEEQDDLELFRHATQPEDFTYLIDQMSTQVQEATVLSIQAIPYVGAYEGAIKLQQFSANITEGKKYELKVTSFQQRLEADRAALAVAKANEYTGILSQIDQDIASIQIPLIRAKTNFFLKRFKQEVHDWGMHHKYMDRYNGQQYPLDYEYDTQGIGSDLDTAVKTAQTMDSYQAAITLINNNLLHLKAMEADFGDRTPWNRAHLADLRLMKYYDLNGSKAGSVMVVSLVEQTLRLYQNGNFVKAFQITSGQYDRPSPPGFWNIFLRQHPTQFKSSEPKGSAFWYPPTPIQYAMEYHDGGYFFHDSWWRANYGSGTNFPHWDSGGDETFAGNGSHGCINMAPNDANWLYHNTGYGTSVIIY